jgi:hypothetical protein
MRPKAFDAWAALFMTGWTLGASWGLAAHPRSWWFMVPAILFGALLLLGSVSSMLSRSVVGWWVRPGRLEIGEVDRRAGVWVRPPQVAVGLQVVEDSDDDGFGVVAPLPGGRSSERLGLYRQRTTAEQLARWLAHHADLGVELRAGRPSHAHGPGPPPGDDAPPSLSSAE